MQWNTRFPLWKMCVAMLDYQGVYSVRKTKLAEHQKSSHLYKRTMISKSGKHVIIHEPEKFGNLGMIPPTLQIIQMNAAMTISRLNHWRVSQSTCSPQSLRPTTFREQGCSCQAELSRLYTIYSYTIYYVSNLYPNYCGGGRYLK